MRILLTTTPRTGSTVVSDVLAALIGTGGEVVKDVIGTGLPREKVIISDFEAGEIYGRLHRKGHVHKLHSIYLHHALQAAEHVDDMFVVNVMRDFKDVYVSRYFYERYYATDRVDIDSFLPMIELFAQMNDPDDVSFLNAFTNTPGILRLIEHWADFSLNTEHPKHLRVLYADVVERPEWIVQQIVDFLGISCNNTDAALDQLKFKPDTGDERRRFRRKGIIGNHKSYLKPESIQKIDELIESYLFSQPSFMTDPSQWSLSSVTR